MPVERISPFDPHTRGGSVCPAVHVPPKSVSARKRCIMNTLMSKTAFRLGIGAASIILCLALVALPVSQAFASDTADRGPGRANSAGDMTRAPGDADDVGGYRIYCETNDTRESGGGGSNGGEYYDEPTAPKITIRLFLTLYFRLLGMTGTIFR